MSSAGRRGGVGAAGPGARRGDAGERDDGRAPALEQHLQAFAHRRLVLDDDDQPALSVTPTGALAGDRPRRDAGAAAARQLEREHRAAADLRRRLSGASISAGQPLDDRQAEAQALLLLERDQRAVPGTW